MKKNILRKMWWDARFGHLNYLMFFLVFLNFILISFNFLIEDNSNFNGIIDNLWVFGIIFVILYVPVSTIIGRWHTKTQISEEMKMKVFQDPILAKMIRTLLDVQTGKATKDEVEEFRKMIKEIETKDIDEF